MAEVNGGGNSNLLPPTSAYFRQALKTKDNFGGGKWRKYPDTKRIQRVGGFQPADGE